jgi:hypothetical protein
MRLARCCSADCTAHTFLQNPQGYIEADNEAKRSYPNNLDENQ